MPTVDLFTLLGGEKALADRAPYLNDGLHLSGRCARVGWGGAFVCARIVIISYQSRTACTSRQRQRAGAGGGDGGDPDLLPRGGARHDPHAGRWVT